MDDIRARMIAKAKAREASESIEEKSATSIVVPNPVPEVHAKASPPTDKVEPDEGSIESDVENVASVPLDEAGHRGIVIENMTKISDAIAQLKKSQRGNFPVCGYLGAASNPTGLSWRVQILPYLGYQDLYSKFDFQQPYYAEVNQLAAKEIPFEFRDPTNPQSLKTRIQALSGDGTIFGPLGGRSIKRSTMEEQRVNPADIAMVIETASEDAVNWSEPADVEIDFANFLPLGKTYETGTLAIWGDSRIFELNPDITSIEQIAVFRASQNGNVRRGKVAHKAVANARALLDSQLEEHANKISSEASEVSDALSNDDQSSTILISANTSMSSEAIATARKATKTSLVFSSYNSYKETGRFFDAFEMHLASLVIGVDKLPDRFQWSPTLSRPVYGFEVGVGVFSRGNLRKENRIPFDLLAEKNFDFPFHKEIDELTGAPGVKVLDVLRTNAINGGFGAWAQASSQELLDKSAITKRGSRTKNSSSTAIKQGNYFPGVRYYQNGFSIANYLDLAQSDDLDFLVVVACLNDEKDSQLTLQLYDVQSRKKLFESFTLRASSFRDAEEDPLKEQPLAKWILSFESAFSLALETSRMPNLKVDQVRNRIRTLLNQDKTRITIREFLETKLYRDLGLISGVELEKVVAKWHAPKEGESLNSAETFQRLQVIESYLPKDWESPVDAIVGSSN